MRNEIFVKELEKFYKFYLQELHLSNKSQYTIASYNTTISSFIEFVRNCSTSMNLKSLKKIDILNFLEYKNEMLQKQTETKPATKRLYITHLKMFFAFIDENMDDLNLKLSSIFKINIKVPKREPKGISKKDADKFEIYLSELPKQKFIDIRNALVLKILFYTGARRGELANITTDKIAKKDNLFVISTIGKGNKERYLFIEEHRIKEELSFFVRNGYKYISSTKNNRTMGGDEIYRLVNSQYRKAGIANIYSGAHILRHTFAKRLRKHASIEELKELLGHASIGTTSIYTQSSKEDAENAYIKAIS